MAIESADIVLMKSDLLDVVTAIQLSNPPSATSRRTCFGPFSTSPSASRLPPGVFFNSFGWKLNPMFGAAAMSMSSVCVVSNALRLKLFKPKFHKNQQLKATEAVVETHTIIETTEEKGETAMKKTMMIEGMMCAHCSGRVEKP